MGFVVEVVAAKKNHKLVYFTNIIDPILQIVLYLCLIPFFGVWGIAWALFLKTFILNGIGWAILKKYY